MNDRDYAVLGLVANDPARRRKMLRRAAQEAAKRRLYGHTSFRVSGTDVVVSIGDVDVATYSPWEDDCAHD